MKWILIILMLPVAGCTQFRFVDPNPITWQEVKDSFNPSLPRDHWGPPSNPWALASRDRAMGIILPLQHYGIHVDPDNNRRRFHHHDLQNWNKAMVWDPYLKKYRPYRSRTEYLNGIR